jgi:hypothetical protein
VSDDLMGAVSECQQIQWFGCPVSGRPCEVIRRSIICEDSFVVRGRLQDKRHAADGERRLRRYTPDQSGLTWRDTRRRLGRSFLTP